MHCELWPSLQVAQQLCWFSQLSTVHSDAGVSVCCWTRCYCLLCSGFRSLLHRRRLVWHSLTISGSVSSTCPSSTFHFHSLYNVYVHLTYWQYLHEENFLHDRPLLQSLKLIALKLSDYLISEILVDLFQMCYQNALLLFHVSNLLSKKQAVVKHIKGIISLDWSLGYLEVKTRSSANAKRTAQPLQKY